MVYKLSFVVFLFSCLQFNLTGQGIQPCLPEGIIFDSQASIDNFNINYPGCNAILGNLTIQGGDILSLEGLSNIDRVGGNVEITSNPALQNLKGINLDSILGDLILENNSSLKDLNGLDSLSCIKSRLWIFDNDGLINLSGAKRLHLIKGDFDLSSNDKIINFGNFQVDSILGEVGIGLNSHLKNFLGLDSLKYIGGSFLVTSNYSLDDFTGTSSLKIIGGRLDILNNVTMVSVSGMTALDSIYGGFDLYDNNALADVDGLESVEYIGQGLWIANNPSLTQLPVMTGLDSIGNSILITDNHSLNDLTGLDSLKILEGTLLIENNEVLKSLNGLNGLRQIRGNIQIFNNDLLSNVSALSGIIPQSITEVAIENCQVLSDCAIESFCNFLIGGGNSFVSNNTTGCNSAEEILLACFVAADEPENGNEISLYPNPTSGLIEINGLTSYPSSITVVNAFGQTVGHVTSSIASIDLSSLDNGIYFISIVAQTQRAVKRVLKLN